MWVFPACCSTHQIILLPSSLSMRQNEGPPFSAKGRGSSGKDGLIMKACELRIEALKHALPTFDLGSSVRGEKNHPCEVGHFAPIARSIWMATNIIEAFPKQVEIQAYLISRPKVGIKAYS